VSRAPQKPDVSKIKLAIDHDLIRELAKLLEETGLTEIEIEQDGMRVRAGRADSGHVQSPAAPAAAPVAPGAVSPDPTKHPGVVTSPMVGTAYLSPEPGAKPFVEIGSRVNAGDTLLVVEAMKTMNQIPAPHAGVVTQILIEDGHPLEFGAPLMIIE
jgi:acetyl-CoA carboxylase biotin carboxyl carrier protein